MKALPFRVGLGVGLGVVALLLAGCSNSEPVSSSTTSSSTTTSSVSRSSVIEVPSISTPLDTTKFDTDPCALLSSAQRGELGLPNARPELTSGRAACDFTVEASPKPLVFLRVQVMAGSSLASWATQCKGADCTGWSSTTVEGYPVIRANGATETKYGSCKLLLGVSEKAVVLINDVKTDSANEPNCVRSEKVAAMVVAALK